jgi:hypothetical protein
MNNFNLAKYAYVMVFYIILSYIVGPIIGYYTLGKTSCAAGHGFVVGSILSIVLWYTVWCKMVKGK